MREQQTLDARYQRSALARAQRQARVGIQVLQRFQWVPYHPRVDYCRPEQVSAAFRAYDAGAGAGARYEHIIDIGAWRTG